MMTSSSDQYKSAIRHTASRPYTPTETIDLIAALWDMPHAVVCQDIRDARNALAPKGGA